MHIPTRLLSAALLSSVASAQGFVVVEEDAAPQLEKISVPFAAPVRLRAGNQFVHTESPGWAAPAWFDVDRDGVKDLVVGQFAGGKMVLCRGQKDGSFAAQEWLQADGDVAEVPGVW